MKKILVIGTLNIILKNICECLMDDYNVQLCSENEDEINTMIKLLKPELVIVNEISLDVNVTDLYIQLSKIYNKKPVLIISTSENPQHSDMISKLLPKSIFLYKPITKYKLLATCNELLNPISSNEVCEKTPENDGDKNEADNTTEADNLKTEKKKVLVIDDSVILLRNIKTMLENEYQVFTVTSGERALKSISKIRPDVILLDYAMPDWDGKKTFEMLSEDEIGCNIPVIFLTSVSDKQQILDVLMLKPFGYILKPPSKDRITDEIRKALDSTWIIG
ncbi:MAG: response regulator [Lachnospira sp.]